MRRKKNKLRAQSAKCRNKEGVHVDFIPKEHQQKRSKDIEGGGVCRL